MHTCAIIEVNEESEETLRVYIKYISFLELIWVCETIDQALALTKDNRVDLLFLSLPDHSASFPDENLFNLIEHCRFIIGISPAPENSLPVNVPVLAHLQKPLVFDQFIKAIEVFIAK